VPTRAPRRCTRTGCPNGADCTLHRRPRPTRQELGYDAEWLAISKAYLAEHPWCESGRHKRWARARHVDHIDGDRTNREEWNLQALCVPCHSSKTVLYDGGFGRPRTVRDA